MNSSLKLKIGLVLLLLVFCALALLPSLNPGLPDWWKKYMAPAGLKLGLDLQGGMHIVLQVDLDKAAENSLDLSATDFKSALAEKNINAVRMDSGTAGSILFTLPNTGAIDTVKQILKDSFPNLETQVEAEEGSFPRITLQLSRQEIEYIRKNAVNQSLEIIRNRIDQFGVAEPDIRKQLDNRIIVQLPGLDDPKRAINIIGRTAHLEFKLVDETADVQAAAAGKVPAESELAFMVSKRGGAESKTPIVLKSEVVLTGEYITDANVQFDSYGQAYVGMNFNARGARIFEEVTGANDSCLDRAGGRCLSLVAVGIPVGVLWVRGLGQKELPPMSHASPE